MDKTNRIAALFDFDGVVMDTETQYSKFWKMQGNNYHPEIVNFELLIKGQTLDQIYCKYFAGMTDVQETIQKELNKFEEEMAYEFIPGVLDFVGELRSLKVYTAVVTSSNEAKMSNVYKAHPRMKELFDHIVVANDFVNSKPDPECFLLGAKKLGAIPENCFVFEDSFHGLEAGKRAGMTVIALSTTNSYELVRDKANLVISDFREFSYDKMLAAKTR